MSVDIVFDEIVLDSDLFNLGFAQGSPEYANANIRSPITGITKVAVTRFDPQWVLSVNFDDVKHADAAAGVDYLLKMWYGGQGSAYGFRVRLEWDHILNDEVIAVGDGVLTDFKVTKEYERPGTSGHSYTRRIIKPVVSTNLSTDSVTLYEADGSTARIIEVPFTVSVDDSDVPSGWKISNTTGLLSFDSAPHGESSPEAGDGAVIAVSGQFDLPCQFWTNSFSLQADWPASLKNLSIIEIVPAALNIT